MKITVKDAVCSTLLASLFIITALNSTIFGQEKKSESQPGRWLIDSAKQEEKPQPTPEPTKKTMRERKVENANQSSVTSVEPAEDYSTQPQPNAMPTVDYLKETEKFQRQMNANSQRQNADAQRQIEEIRRESQAESDRQREIQDQIMQQGNDRLNNMTEQQNQNFNESNKQQKAAQRLTVAQWK